MSSSLLLVVAVFALIEWIGNAPGEGPSLIAFGATAAGGLALAAALTVGHRLVRRAAERAAARDAKGGRAPRPAFLGRREALVLVTLTWLIGSVLSAIPFRLWAGLSPTLGPDHPFADSVSCLFESVSGLTTTGATVLSDIESLPRSLLLWRALTHWVGGLGIVLLFVAVLPSVGIGGKRLFIGEATGPSPAGITPRIRDTARTLVAIYAGLTLAETLALRFAGMAWFDAVTNSFATLATGGFCVRNASIAAYASPMIEAIIIAFMLLAGINFALYYALFNGRVRPLLSDTQARVFLASVLGGSAIAAFSVWLAGDPIHTAAGEAIEATPGESLRAALFSVSSVHTATGFATADFDRFPFMARAVLVGAMFLGGCAGSTAGGMKIVRAWVALKVVLQGVEREYRPQVVRKLRVARQPVSSEQQLAMLRYIVAMFLVFLLGSVVVMALEGGTEGCGYTTAATATIACFSNVGPGLELVGPVRNFGWMTAPTKLVLCLVMLLGRLEIGALVAMLLPDLWRGD